MSSSFITKKESPYNPFLERVLLPGLRVGIVALVIALIGLGSWLEANESIEDCSFKSSLSFHQIYLYRNITSNLTTPDAVSFGLWKTCYLYALNCSCTPTNLRYQPDIATLLQVATTHNATPPISATSVSLARIVPLIIAVVFCFIAFVIGFRLNRQHHYQHHSRGLTKRWTTSCKIIACLLLLLTAVFTAYVFGQTYTSYFQQIKDTCQDPNNKVYCARHAVGIEVILFGIALGLLVLVLILWLIFTVSTAFATEPQNTVKAYNTDAYNHGDDDLPDGCCWRFKRKEYKENAFKQQDAVDADDNILKHQMCYTSFYKDGSENYSNSTQSNHQELNKLQQSSDELAVWRDIALYDMHEKKATQDISTTWNSMHQTHQPRKHPKTTPLSSLPPPPHHVSTTVPLIDTIKGSKSRVTSERKVSHDSCSNPTAAPSPHSSENKHYRYSLEKHSGNGHRRARDRRHPQQKYRRTRDTNRHYGYASYKNDYYDHKLTPSPTGSGTSGSTNDTIGNNTKRHKTRGNLTPTAMSPHPFQYPVSYSPTTVNNRSAFCMTPFQNEDSYSSGSNASHGKATRDSTGSISYFSQQPHQVPILSMPPVGNARPEVVEHPLNKKVIKDKRIQGYLQNS